MRGTARSRLFFYQFFPPHPAVPAPEEDRAAGAFVRRHGDPDAHEAPAEMDAEEPRPEHEIRRQRHGAHLAHLRQVSRAAVMGNENRRGLTHHGQREHDHIEHHIVIAHGGHRVLRIPAQHELVHIRHHHLQGRLHKNRHRHGKDRPSAAVGIGFHIHRIIRARPAPFIQDRVHCITTARGAQPAQKRRPRGRPFGKSQRISTVCTTL